MNRKKIAIFNDTRRTSHYGCEFVMENLFRELENRNLEPVFYWPVGMDWRSVNGLMSNIKGVDAIIVNGEGSIHHDRPPAEYLSEIAPLIGMEHNIPCFLINASVYEVRESVISNLRHFRKIYVRETLTEESLKQHDISAQVVPDLTFLTHPPDDSRRLHPVLCTDSVNRSVAREIKEISKGKGWHFLKMVHSSRPLSFEHGHGWEFYRRYAKWFYALVLRQNTKRRQSFMSYLSSHELLCTGRFHGVTLSIVTRTPFIAVGSNTPKISGLLQDVFGSRKRLVELNDFRAVNNSLDHGWTDEEKVAVDSYNSKARNAITKMFDEIRDCIDTSR